MMSDHPPAGSSEVAQRVFRQAHLSATSAVLRVARATGARVISRPVWPGMISVPDYAEPASGLRIARALESAATNVTRDYIRYAREAGLKWQEIGAELGLSPESSHREISVGDAAFEFATSARKHVRGWRSAPTFLWNCPECGSLVRDYGPSAGAPSDQEQGHAADCRRMAAELAEWDAERTNEDGS
jgi:hypothetical protein